MDCRVSILLAALLLASTGTVGAAPKDTPHQLLAKIVQCRASSNEVRELNRLIDGKKIPYSESKTVDIWGGKAWDVDPPISHGGVTSGVLVLPDRASLYLRVQAKADLGAEMRAVAERLHVPAQGDGSTPNYLAETSRRRAHILPSDEKNVYWVGCTY